MLKLSFKSASSSGPVKIRYFALGSIIWLLVIQMVSVTNPSRSEFFSEKSASKLASVVDMTFQEAAVAYNIPADFLKAMSYPLSQWEQRPGIASIDGSYGFMQLISSAD
jgi:hypothetical protein